MAALAALTACGSLAASGQGGGAGRGAGATAARHGGLCASRAGLTSLMVRRVGVLPLLRQEQGRGVRARSHVAAVRARKVADEICGLPRSRHGARSCPDDIGIVYKLYFTAGPRHFRTVTARVTGCQQVTGAGKPRSAAGHPGFWVALARDVQMPPLRLPVDEGRPGQAGNCHPASKSTSSPGNCPGPRSPA